MRKKICFVGFISCIFLISLVSVSSNFKLTSTSSFETTSSKKDDNEKQKISEPSSLPSELVFCGVFPIASRPDAGPDRRDAFYIAIDEINNQTGAGRILPSGVSIKAIALDSLNSVAGGTNAANSCDAQGAHIVIGASSSSVSAAMQDVLKTIPIVQISYASGSPTLSDRTAYPYFMRVSSNDNDQGFALIDLVDSFGFTKGALIHTDDIYGSGTPSVFLNNWDGEIVTQQTFSPGASDVSTQIQALKNSVENEGVEFIHLSAIDVYARTVIKEAYQVGLTNNENVTFIINDGPMTTATFAGDIEVENGMQNMLGTNPDFVSGPNYQSFIDTWNTVSTCSNSTGDFQITCGFARTGNMPNSYAPLAYDAVYVATKGFADAFALNSSFSATPAEADQLLDALYNVTHAGAGKYIEFNDLGETYYSFQYMTLNNSIFDIFGTWNGTAYFSVNSIILPGGVEWYWNGIRFVPYVEHAAIRIDGNADLVTTAQSEGWLGNGSKSNPFIIKQYNITGTAEGIPIDPYNLPPVNMSDPYRILIEINNTDLYVKIKDNWLVGAGDSAIVLRNVTNAELNGNIVTKSLRHAIRFSDSVNITAIENDVFSNGGIGLGMWFSNNSQITQNSLFDNGVNGIYTVGTRFNVIQNNFAYNNIWHGIALDYYSENNSVLFNEVFGNGREGIGFWDHSKYNIIEFNQILNNNWDPVFGIGGIAGWDSSNNIIRFNQIENHTHGIYFASSNNTEIEKNDILNNQMAGIFISNAPWTLILDNNIYDNEGQGIFMTDNSHRSQITGNTVYGNLASGINFANTDFVSVTDNIVIQNNDDIFLELNSNYFNIANNLVGNIKIIGNSNHNIIEKNDVVSGAIDQGTNNSFVLNHWSGWLSTETYSFIGNQDTTPVSTPYHTSELVFISISYNILDGKVDITWQPVTDSLGHEIRYSLFFSSDGGLTWELFDSSVSVTSYSWDVSSLSDGLSVNIKIEAKDDIGFIIEIISDTSLVISNPEPTTSTTPPTTTPPNSKPSDTSTGITTTAGLELLGLLFSLFGIIFIRKKTK